MPATTELSQFEKQRIAESIVGGVDWFGPQGYCVCPGLSLHSTRNATTDCKVVIEPVSLPDGVLKPGVYCHHDSCGGECDGASFALRSQLGKASPQRLEQRPISPPPVFRPKADFNPATLARIAAKGPKVDDRYLWARSGKTPWNRTAAAVLRSITYPGEKVLIFTSQESQGQALWENPGYPYDASALDHFGKGHQQGVWFLSNPVSGEWYPKPLPDLPDHKTRRDFRCVTSWRYMVLESDKARSDHWLSVLVQMPLKIAAIYTSGGRSIHALVRIDAESKEDWDAKCNAMKEPLVILGADRKALSAVRLTRLPCCERPEKNGMQTLLYLTEEPDSTPICRKEPTINV